MGLDMYLYKKNYIGANYEHNHINGTLALKREEEPINIDINKIVYIIENQAYWRKANQIHYWFVLNVQHGEDDCKPYEVSGEKLLELVDLCKKVLANHSLAEEYLPTYEGFFFGSYDYDEYYFEDIESTIEQLSDIDPDEYYEYQSSW